MDHVIFLLNDTAVDRGFCGDICWKKFCKHSFLGRLIMNMSKALRSPAGDTCLL